MVSDSIGPVNPHILSSSGSSIWAEYQRSRRLILDSFNYLSDHWLYATHTNSARKLCSVEVAPICTSRVVLDVFSNAFWHRQRLRNEFTLS